MVPHAGDKVSIGAARLVRELGEELLVQVGLILLVLHLCCGKLLSWKKLRPLQGCGKPLFVENTTKTSSVKQAGIRVH